MRAEEKATAPTGYDAVDVRLILKLNISAWGLLRAVLTIELDIHSVLGCTCFGLKFIMLLADISVCLDHA